ncbi:unnamed protein product [Oncorhynchus mykiss]|uniref:Uncharacterized protein n=1 Tax=Oncorhynchus mykiss TaxID=8022 RepID=A0A060Y059_ONCMY|nr:unnamed protein product [Oncorhynchus mykiss]
MLAGTCCGSLFICLPPLLPTSKGRAANVRYCYIHSNQRRKQASMEGMRSMDLPFVGEDEALS